VILKARIRKERPFKGDKDIKYSDESSPTKLRIKQQQKRNQYLKLQMILIQKMMKASKSGEKKQLNQEVNFNRKSSK